MRYLLGRSGPVPVVRILRAYISRGIAIVQRKCRTRNLQAQPFAGSENERNGLEFEFPSMNPVCLVTGNVE